MRKKTVALLLLITFSIIPLFAATDLKKSLLALHRENNTILPVDSVLGQTVSPSSSEIHSFLAKAFSEEYSFDWSEQYFDDETKSPLALLYSSFLSQNLPSTANLYSKAVKNPDGTVSVLVRFESGDIATFSLRDNRIFAVSL